VKIGCSFGFESEVDAPEQEDRVFAAGVGRGPCRGSCCQRIWEAIFLLGIENWVIDTLARKHQ
jgi:hypothetical protein